MTCFVALLRAVNVGGTGKLPMSDLKRLCEAAGFADVRTFIASGNVVLGSERSEKDVKAVLEKALRSYAGKPVGVAVRSAAEMAAVVANNPFPTMAPERTVAIFIDQPPAPDVLGDVIGLNKEKLALGTREIYVHYGEGMARTKLRIPSARGATARNMRTVAKLADMAASGSRG